VTLSAGQLDTLRNLAGKKAGGDVGWVNIAIARELTELGLAARNQSGWVITTSGEAALELEGGPTAAEDADTTLPFHARNISPRPGA
jgi:hypothetical protein